ncbi:MAG TPA: carbamoyltransferase C-terminal domain-containing protein [Candidatus Sulfotelmatobacter sp.]|jgi:carbamoyltransferase|nr:carbamoyltransferase C-terminal domain-containing protein [Candidatus Sulfotelmatobacter sp.]
MLILGLNMFHADASAAIVVDGEVKFAIAEERLNRRKHFGGFPALAVRACLDSVGAKISDVEHIAVGQDSDANLARKVQYALTNPAKVLNFIRLRQRKEAMRDVRSLLAKSLDVDSSQLRFQEHHLEHHIAHIASAYYCSPWDNAAGFSYDGSGDFVSTMMARCEGNEVEVLERVFLPHSLGSFYTMICEFIGYSKYGDEGKVMGLAPYGKKTYCEAIEKLVTPKNGGFQLDLRYFKPLGSNQGMQVLTDGTVKLARHFSDRMQQLFGEPRKPHDEITQRDMDLAFALQHRFEEIFFHLLNQLHKKVPVDHLAMAGGCALNSVANGKLFDRTPFRQTYIQPAAGDEGLAIGAALHTYHSVLKQPRRHELKNSYLGPEFSDSQIESALRSAGLQYRKLNRHELLDQTAQHVAAGHVVGWFQGRMEWGPRALGNRSIVAHPGLPNMKEVLNARIKHREWFRPFAPSILAEYQHEYFEHDHPSPFMLHVYRIRPEKRAALCAVNHVDDTGRLQTVAREENPLYYDLISAFHRKTGIAVILNTSFNENEPIVCTPKEAIDCFKRTRMDVLAIGSFVVAKADAVSKKPPVKESDQA